MAYKLLEKSFLDLDTGTSIPFDSKNRHYKKVVSFLISKGLAAYNANVLEFFPDGIDLFNIDHKSLDDMKKEAKEEIDKEAGLVRTKYITTVPGQAETYIMKSIEARQYKNDGYPVDTTNYPLVQAESMIIGDTPTVAANYIISTELNWKQLAAAIEIFRRTGKITIDNATDIETVESAKVYAIFNLRSI